MTADMTLEAGRTDSDGSDLESSAMKPGDSAEHTTTKGSKDPLSMLLAPFEMCLGSCMSPKDPSAGPVRLAHRAPWVRAGLLGAQDGLVSVSSLIIGVGAVSGSRSSMVVSGLAGEPASTLPPLTKTLFSAYTFLDLPLAAIPLLLSPRRQPFAICPVLPSLAAFPFHIHSPLQAVSCGHDPPSVQTLGLGLLSTKRQGITGT